MVLSSITGGQNICQEALIQIAVARLFLFLPFLNLLCDLVYLFISALSFSARAMVVFNLLLKAKITNVFKLA